MTTHTTEQAAIVAQIRTGFESRIDAIEAAIVADQGGYIFCWDKYGLGVHITPGGGSFSVVSTEQATLVDRNDLRTFRNGGNERAILTRRSFALGCALRTVSASLAHFEVALAKQEA